ncbi:MAG: PH domain-containing protein, partial [Acidimicrobiia bacterium]|nr:PH domain-containing protein [Acidimicrobiia bacterium]
AQSATARSSPFQRRAGLATLVVDVAGPGTSPQVIDEATATVRSLQRALVVR